MATPTLNIQTHMELTHYIDPNRFANLSGDNMEDLSTAVAKCGASGAHCGLTDWYPELESALKDVLKRKVAFDTGWYGSKKEIASARIIRNVRGIYIEVSVSDDFDTEGSGSTWVTTKNPTLEQIRKAIYKAWDKAEDNQKSNRLYVGFSVHNAKGNWIETIILPSDKGDGCEEPPGDYYPQWGLREETTIPKAEATKLLVAAWTYISGSKKFKELKVGKYTIKPWDEKK